jgi:integrase
MHVTTNANPALVLVDPVHLWPRFWATAWSVGLAGKALSPNTVLTKLRHVDAFYLLCDERFGNEFGPDSLDKAISLRDTVTLNRMVEVFYLWLTSDPQYTQTTVQRWDAVLAFIEYLAKHLGVASEAMRALSASIEATGRIRPPRPRGFKFSRALPDITLADLVAAAAPDSPRNPFESDRVKYRNWLILLLLLECGLRRGEAMLLMADSLKQGVDPETGELVQWLDVTTTEDKDPRATKPSIKTAESHRQIPVTSGLAEIYWLYVSEFRAPSDTHGFLLMSRDGHPLSAESFNKFLEKLSNALSSEAKKRFHERTGGRTQLSPHDLRHTCATVKYKAFMKWQPDKELAFQRMRAFFGWAPNSTMPNLYARAAIQDDLLRVWNELFSQRVSALREVR